MMQKLMSSENTFFKLCDMSWYWIKIDKSVFSGKDQILFQL